MSWNIPETWQMVTLADVCYRIVDGSHNPPVGQASGKPMLSAKNIQNGKIHFDELRLLSDEDFEVENKRTNISAGDVLLTIVGALGRTAVVPELHNEFTLQRSVAVLKPETINSNYLRYLLDSPIAQTFFLENAKGTAQKGIYLKALGAMPAPIAPLAEQTRIAQKLDELLAQVDTLKARIDAIPALLKRFRQSVLAAAVSGRLTEEWRKQNSSSDEVTKTLKLSEIASEIVDCPHSTPKWQSYGKKCVRTTEFSPGFLDVHAAGFVSEETYADRTRRIKPAGGDILYAREGTVGIACPVPHDVDLCMGQRMVLIRAGAEAHPTYLLHVLNSELVLSKVRSLVMGSTAPRVNVKDLKNFEIPAPSFDEQTEIVRRVEQLFAFADQLEAKVASAKSRIDHLTQSILAKAFRGELVPQDPNDEPASVLLERIKTQRAAAPKAKRGRKTSA